MVCNTIATTETSTNSIHNFRTQMVLQKCPGLRQNNEPLPPLSGHWTRTLKMINVDRSSSLCWGGQGQLSGQGIQLWAIALQMNILSQEDITTATTAAKTAKYKWPAALFRVYGNNIQKKKTWSSSCGLSNQFKYTQKHWQSLNPFNPVPILHGYQSATVCHFSHLK